MTDVATEERSARAWLERLVAFDTTSHKTNLPLLDFVEPHLQNLGFRTARVPAPTGEAKANLIASVGQEGPGGIILSGHTDVVPVEGQAWSHDPWTLIEKDDRLYGRGACDMKGFLACCLAAAPAMAAADLKRPLRLAFSYDEEVGFHGARPLVEALVRDFPVHEACIVGEPTRMRVVDGCKGVAYFKTIVTGRAAHSSSRGQGVSAVVMAGRLIAALDALEAEAAEAAPANDAFDPPHTTFGANVVEGGSAGNILADRCSFVWDCRAAPGGLSADEVKARLHKVADAMLARVRPFAPEAAVVTETIADGPPLAPRAGNRARDLCFALTGRNAAEAVAYAAEGGIFQGGGIDTVLCGPGDIAQAHQPDEYVEVSELAACDAFLHRLITRMAA